MKKVQLGTILDEDQDTKVIYNRFHDYFEVVRKYEWLDQYVISKEPSNELIKEIELYYEKEKKRNQKHDEFVDRVANEIYATLSEKDKAYIFDHPSSSKHHFGLGMNIRNTYIYGKELGFDVFYPDHLSSEITLKIASLIIHNFDYENPFYHHLYDNNAFNHVRLLYHAVTGEYPDKLMDEYADMPDDFEAAKLVEEKVKAIVLDAERFKKLSIRYGLNEKQYQEYKKFVDEYNSTKWDIIPYDVAILSSKTLEPDVRKRLLHVLEVVLHQRPDMAFEMPIFVFHQKDAVLLAISTSGCSLKRFKRFNADDEIIRNALTNNGEAIQYVNVSCRNNTEYIKLALSSKFGNALKKRCMIPYRDKEEYVRIALEVNGRNIEWVSPRLKDDFETAAFAIRHQRNWFPESTVCNLSVRLRDDLRIALIDITEGHACVSDYSRRLRNSDEVAQALMESDKKWCLYMMSERIQEKYGH